MDLTVVVVVETGEYPLDHGANIHTTAPFKYQTKLSIQFSRDNFFLLIYIKKIAALKIELRKSEKKNIYI